MKEYCLSSEEVKSRHQTAALGVYINRKTSRPWESDVRELQDWLDGHHVVGKEFSEGIVTMLQGNKDGLVLSDQMLRYLQSISLEEYKSILAYSFWKNKGAVVNNDQSRADEDWISACNAVQSYLNIASTAGSDVSVENYLRECNNHSDLITNRKAFWLYLSNPNQDSATNYQTAKDFVDQFYNLKVIIPALKGNNTLRKSLKTLMLSNPQITNMIEFNIFRIKKIESAK